MGYQRTNPTVYAVYWPEIDVFKVGSSEKQRWRAFEIRGAQVLALTDTFPTGVSCYDFEEACFLAVSKVCSPAFETRYDAVPYLGNGGGGYMECFVKPTPVSAIGILRFIDTQLEAMTHAQA